MVCGGEQRHPACIAPELRLDPLEVAIVQLLGDQGGVRLALEAARVLFELGLREATEGPVLAIATWPLLVGRPRVNNMPMMASRDSYTFFLKYPQIFVENKFKKTISTPKFLAFFDRFFSKFQKNSPWAILHAGSPPFYWGKICWFVVRWARENCY